MNTNVYSILNTTIDQNTFNFIKPVPLKNTIIIDIITNIFQIFIVIINI